MGETACKCYVRHLEFLNIKAKRRVRERNTSTYFLDKGCNSTYQQAAERYLKQKGRNISGGKAELIDRVLTHALRTSSAGMLYKMKNLLIHAKTTQVQSPVILMTLQKTLTYIEKSFEVMVVPEEELQLVN